MTNLNEKGGLCGRCGNHSDVLVNVNDNGLYCPHCSFIIGAVMDGKWDDDYDPTRLDICSKHDWVPTHDGSDHFECRYCGVMYG